MPDRSDLVWIDEAVALCGVSRRTLEQLIAQGELAKAEWPHDKKTYLLRSELERYFQARITRRGQADQDEGSAAG